MQRFANMHLLNKCLNLSLSHTHTKFSRFNVNVLEHRSYATVDQTPSLCSCATNNILFDSPGNKYTVCGTDGTSNQKHCNKKHIKDPETCVKKDTNEEKKNISHCDQYDSTLDCIRLMYHQYISDPECVYKMCTDGTVHRDDPTSKWLVVMKKESDTKTNENRENILDPFHAKYRADKLRVLKIINVNDIETTTDSVHHRNQTFGYSAIYTVGSIVKSYNFNENIQEVCSNGIHYYKSLESAFFHRSMPDGYTGRWFCQNSDGSKDWEGYFANGEKNGVHREWDKSEGLTYRIEWLDDTRHGLFLCFYKNGTQKQIGRYSNGSATGVWFEWYKNKSKKNQIEYIAGRRYGQYKSWHENGTKECEGEYLNGKKHGKWTHWYENGEKEIEGEYVDGKENGRYMCWHECGELMCEGSYENGKQEGLWTGYANGDKIVEGIFINGNHHGEWIYTCEFDNQIKVNKINFDGKIVDSYH